MKNYLALAFLIILMINCIRYFTYIFEQTASNYDYVMFTFNIIAFAYLVTVLLFKNKKDTDQSTTE
ncbi:hypothetical protein [Alkalihalobacterium elongatum]|uniref:hypothetical protein n=1 Tax=Alkalihalobacterium elongatum TaxID=2675466 RepID=UPI001C1F7A20|nr:hypothetical protein [Alkalihalobacterium elongatum]